MKTLPTEITRDEVTKTLFGTPERRRRHLSLAAALLAVSIPLSLPGGLLDTSTGVVIAPLRAAALGAAGSLIVALDRGGLVETWLAAYAPLVGFGIAWLIPFQFDSFESFLLDVLVILFHPIALPLSVVVALCAFIVSVPLREVMTLLRGAMTL